MRSVYEREVTSYHSPAKAYDVDATTTVTRTTRSPYSGSKTEVITSSAGKKNTTVTYEGPGYSSKTIYEGDESGTRGGRIHEERKTHGSGTKVVYEGDPYQRESRVTRVERSPGRTYERTTEYTSPGRYADRTTEVVRETRDPITGYSRVERREISPGRTVVTRTVRDEPDRESTYTRTVDAYAGDSKIVRTIRESSPGRTVVTRTIRDSPNRDVVHATKSYKDSPETTTVTRTIRDSPVEKTFVSRTVREGADGRHTTYSRREESPGRQTTTYRREESPGRTGYTRTVIDNGLERSTYTRSIRDEAPKEEVVEERITRVYEDDVTGTKREYISTTYQDDYPRRKKPAETEDDVVVLKYTSPYNGSGTHKPQEKVTSRVYETTTYY